MAFRAVNRANRDSSAFRSFFELRNGTIEQEREGPIGELG